MSTRREFLLASALGTCGCTAASGLAARVFGQGTGARSSLVEAHTSHGRVQGIERDGIRVFKGIPYGASTGGRNRYLPPRRPTPWRGARACLEYGQASPQAPLDVRADPGAAIAGDLQPAGMGEDCLNLNVWTPGLKDGVKRPVLVCLGGGFTRGSGNAAAFDGAPLARAGDVVIVTVNHRLATFGYLQLEELGAPPEFASAGAAGIMDLAAALEWVRDNAENFGGDPQCVMIFGQSGGGAKVSSLLATRAAQGLFHRAAVQSGSLLKFASRESAARQAELFLRQLGIGRARIGELQRLPWQQLLQAQVAAAGAASGLGAAPVLDGRYLTHDPFDPQAPSESARVPLIVSTTLEEAALGLDNFEISELDLRRLLDLRYPGRGAETLALYRTFYPAKSPFLVQAQILTDAASRRTASRQAELKALQGGGAVFMYEWDWPSPAFGGRYGAVGGLDLAASFRDTHRDPDMSRVAEQLSCAWVAFARSGDPNSALLPPWPPFDTTARATMVFGTPTQLINDHRGEIRKFWDQMPPPQSGVDLRRTMGESLDG